MLNRLVSGAADDQRRPGLINQDVVHLVDNGIVALTLHPLDHLYGHVVPQIVKAKLVVGPV